MQPVLRYQAGTYPPRGAVWPQFDERLRITEMLHHTLSHKRDGKAEMHSERLQYHGLAPKAESIDTQTENDQSNRATQTEGAEYYDIGSDPPSPRPGTIKRVIRNYAWPFTKEIGRAAGSAAVAGVKHGVPAAATIAGAAIRHGVPAAAWAVGGIASGIAGLASGSDGPLDIDGPDIKAEPDDDLAISGISVNRDPDLDYWQAQSSNELRKELKLRDMQRFRNEWAFKNKDQMLDIIEGMIQEGTW